MRALLDVNLLIALLDESHIHHRSATTWIEENLQRGWASCPITQNGCIRIMSQPNYPGAITAGLVAERLAEAAENTDHQFWPDDVSLIEKNQLNWTRVLGHRQVTDAYLLALAVKNKGRLASLDQRIPLAAVPTATAENLTIVATQFQNS